MTSLRRLLEHPSLSDLDAMLIKVQAGFTATENIPANVHTTLAHVTACKIYAPKLFFVLLWCAYDAAFANSLLSGESEHIRQQCAMALNTWMISYVEGKDVGPSRGRTLESLVFDFRKMFLAL